MQTLELKASVREGTGKSVTRKLRVQGIVPATLYGIGVPPVNLSLDAAELESLYKGRESSNFILNLHVDDGDAIATIVRERQRHPVGRQVLHVDLQRISMDRPIHVEIPIHLTGECEGVKTFGGTLEHLLRTVAISCLPKHIPDEIIVDVSELNLNDSIHVSDLDVPNIEFEAEAARVVVNVAPPRLSTEVEETDEEGEGEETAEGEEASDEGGDEGDA